jgi:hypothetical protein
VYRFVASVCRFVAYNEPKGTPKIFIDIDLLYVLSQAGTLTIEDTTNKGRGHERFRPADMKTLFSFLRVLKFRNFA